MAGQSTLRSLLGQKKLVTGLGFVLAGLWYYYHQQQKQKLARTNLKLKRAAAAAAAAAAASGEGSTGASAGAGQQSQSSQKGRGKRVGVDAQFVRQLKKLLPICVPAVMSREFGMLVALAIVLLGRTWLDIWFSAFNGEVVKAIVTRDKKTFIAKAVVEFGLMMWPMSVINNLLKLLISSLSIAFRSRLTAHANDKYLDGLTFYKVSNLDNRLSNADQLLTQDIDKFADNLSHLYSDLAKPAVDVLLFAFKLGQALGGMAPVYMISYFLVSGVILRQTSPPFGKYTAQEQKLEGDFRFNHSRIITHSEEIAFYRGQEREKALVTSSFEGIRRHVLKVFQLRFANGVFDSILVKYLATMTAYYLLSKPVFDPSSATELMGAIGADSTQLIEDYSRNSGYLVKLSQAVGSLMMEARTLAQFAGYTSRVAELFDVLDDVGHGRYERTMVEGRDAVTAANNVVTRADLKGTVVTRDNVIEFDRVPIVTPNGDVLVKELSFKVESGMNCLVTGPNGCGKSSLFRILGDLWPLFGGRVTKPATNRLFYVPQKPYLALGTLRDQVIYPSSRKQSQAAGVSDNDLLNILKVVHLEYLVTREEQGWDTVADWADVLSGGEKQRIAMARLFFHRPQFVILDECTSAVSVDVEGMMYTYAKEVGITLFTVSHRQSLWKYHEWLLRFDGEGGYTFGKLNLDENAFAFGHGKQGTVAEASTSTSSTSLEAKDPESQANES